ncbi:hypothetical protein T492DRAFT_1111549 [Pavlovales sp. CCMP2436]|nr:hypothetical protein T492DRAFT_1111549 [Pavlovales sp. CCMP2436]
MKGQYQVKAPNLLPLHQQAKVLAGYMKCTFVHVLRALNTRADALATAGRELGPSALGADASASVSASAGAGKKVGANAVKIVGAGAGAQSKAPSYGKLKRPSFMGKKDGDGKKFRRSTPY